MKKRRRGRKKKKRRGRKKKREEGGRRKRQERGRRKKRWRKEKEEKRKKEEVEIEELTEEEEEYGDDTLNYQAKLMNEENWVKIETTEMKNVKKKRWRRKLKNRKENAGSEMEEKREEEWKAATREKDGNIKEYWGKLQWCNWDMKRKRRVRKKKQDKRRKRGRNSGKGKATVDKFKWSEANE